MTRILITGASGMLGSTLAPALAGAGHQVISHGHSKSSELSQDLTDRDGTAGMIVDAAPEVVINLVALTNVDACQEDPHRAHLLNTRVVENIASALGGRPGAHLIQISTDQVYDGEGPHGEDDVRLTNVYALTKYAGELAAALVPSTILRTNLFGRSQLPGRTSLSDWAIANLGQSKPIKVFTDVYFNPLNMTTLAKMIDRVVRQRHVGTFNLGSRGGMSKAEFAFQIAECFGFETGSMTRDVSTSMAFKAYRPSDMRMDCRRFEETFGVELPTLLDEVRALQKEYQRAA